MSPVLRALLGNVAGVAGGTVATPPVTGPALWLDAQQLALADGAAVVTWPDLSGHARDATQGTLANRPVFVTSGINGHPSVTFASTSTRQFLALPDFLTGLAAGEVFVVVKSTLDPQGTDTRTGLWGLGPLNQTSHFPWTTGEVYEGFGTTARKLLGDPGPPLTTAHVYSVSAASGAWRAWLDGGALSASLANTVSWSAAPVLGTHVATVEGTNYSFNGQIGEVLVYPLALTDTQRADTINFLAAKWGTPTFGTPASDGPPVSGARLRYDAQAMTGVANNAAVPVWRDLSGNNHDAGAVTNAPKYVTSGINGHPALEFGQGSVYGPLGISAGALADATAAEVFVVIQGNTDPGERHGARALELRVRGLRESLPVQRRQYLRRVRDDVTEDRRQPDAVAHDRARLQRDERRGPVDRAPRRDAALHDGVQHGRLVGGAVPAWQQLGEHLRRQDRRVPRLPVRARQHATRGRAGVPASEVGHAVVGAPHRPRSPIPRMDAPPTPDAPDAPVIPPLFPRPDAEPPQDHDAADAHDPHDRRGSDGAPAYGRRRVDAVSAALDFKKLAALVALAAATSRGARRCGRASGNTTRPRTRHTSRRASYDDARDARVAVDAAGGARLRARARRRGVPGVGLRQRQADRAGARHGHRDGGRRDVDGRSRALGRLLRPRTGRGRRGAPRHRARGPARQRPSGGARGVRGARARATADQRRGRVGCVPHRLAGGQGSATPPAHHREA
jgi:hypothetical protein